MSTDQCLLQQRTPITHTRIESLKNKTYNERLLSSPKLYNNYIIDSICIAGLGICSLMVLYSTNRL